MTLIYMNLEVFLNFVIYQLNQLFLSFHFPLKFHYSILADLYCITDTNENYDTQ